MKYFLFQFTPPVMVIGKKAAVHAGNHDAVRSAVFDHLTKARRNDDSPFWVDGMKGASPKHASPLSST
jgi:hypothetical protein